MKQPYILHPFVLAVFPILSVYAANIYEVHFTAALRSLAVSFGSALVLVLFFRLISGSWRRAALGTSLFILLFFSYGHFYIFFSQKFPDTVLARADILLAIWATVLIIGTYAFLRTRRKMVEPTRLANVFSLVLLATIVFSIPRSAKTLGDPITWKTPTSLAPQPGPNWDGQKPDIYYIILDSYGSEAVLRDFYGVENAPFLESLRQRGFTVAEHSLTNYWKTGLSLSSSLNFHYVDDLVEMPEGSNDPRAVEEMIAHGAARKFLEDLGYKTITFSTNFDFTDVKDAEIYYAVKHPLTPFELNLLMGSMAIFWVDFAQPAYHRAEIHQHFADLRESARVEGPKFVFAHLLMPHVPFVFDAEGNPVAPAGNVDGDSYTGGVEHYLQGYAGQVQYTNRLITEAIDSILAESSTPPIIILQGDHGPGAYLMWHSVDESCLRERFPILNAYYLPGEKGTEVDIPADITPVNSFRMVFNTYFDTRLPYEPNRYYAGTIDALYEFTDVTGQVDWCPVLRDKGG